MKFFIITLWLACGMAVSLAEPARWGNVNDLISWLQSRKTLDIEEYRAAQNALGHFQVIGGLEFEREGTASELITTLTLRRFAELRENKDLYGVSEFVEADYSSDLKFRIMEILADGKDEEFSARVLYHAVDSKTWTTPVKGFSPPYNEARQKLFDKLVGNPKTLEVSGTMDSTDGRMAVKRELAKKWPVLLEEAVTPRERKPSANENSRDTIAKAHPRKDHPVPPGLTDDKRAMAWLLAILSLLITGSVFLYWKSRYR